MGAQSVGFFEAWALWAQGVDVKPLSLNGFPMIWVGRIAKVVSYVAGLTIVLDIIGPERIRDFAKRLQRRQIESFWLTWEKFIRALVFLLLFLACFYAVTGSVVKLVLATYGIAAVSAIIAMGPKATFGAARLLEIRTTEVAIRASAFTLFTVAFSFDLLTS